MTNLKRIYWDIARSVLKANNRDIFYNQPSHTPSPFLPHILAATRPPSKSAVAAKAVAAYGASAGAAHVAASASKGAAKASKSSAVVAGADTPLVVLHTDFTSKAFLEKMVKSVLQGAVDRVQDRLSRAGSFPNWWAIHLWKTPRRRDDSFRKSLAIQIRRLIAMQPSAIDWWSETAVKQLESESAGKFTIVRVPVPWSPSMLHHW